MAWANRFTIMRSCVITHPGCCRHDLPGHPESQTRLDAALKGVPDGIGREEAPAATSRELLRVHLPDYIAQVEQASFHCPADEFRFLDPDTYVTPYSFEATRYAAGGAIAAVNKNLDGQNCFSMMRPPGHHAFPHHSMGFCIFNNPSIAAAAALKEVERVAIVDWDVHHGNGTQYVWYHSDRVLYCSVHQEGIFPGTGMPQERGSGEGEGYTINVPLQPGASIGDYSYVFTEGFVPAITTFDPEVLIVSAGMDCLSDDLLGRMKLYPQDFGTLTSILSDATELPLSLLLEGGYSPSLGESVQAIFEALDGKRNGMPEESPRRETVARVEAIKTNITD